MINNAVVPDFNPNKPENEREIWRKAAIIWISELSSFREHRWITERALLACAPCADETEHPSETESQRLS